MDIPSTAPPHVPTTVALTNPANGGPVIYSAIYSGVPVYEMMCRDTPVMRRMADAYMNATQILKVAGFTKPKRTKILEREVLQGEHEKIQGGYGKYQGTWIPLSESRQLAGRYNVEVDLRALFDFDPQTGSVAPKPPTIKSNPADFHGDIIASPQSSSPSLHAEYFLNFDGQSQILSGGNSPEGSSTPRDPMSPIHSANGLDRPPPPPWPMDPSSYQSPTSELASSSSDANSLRQTPAPVVPPSHGPQDVQAFFNSLGMQSLFQQSPYPGHPPPGTSTYPSESSTKSFQDLAASAANTFTPSAPHPYLFGHSSHPPPQFSLPPSSSAEAEYFQKLQQGLGYDETTAQNYVAQLQQFLKSQDMSQFQQSQPQSSPLVSGGQYPSVQSAYQQLAMLNLLSLAAQHAYTYPTTGYTPFPNPAEFVSADVAASGTRDSTKSSENAAKYIPEMSPQDANIAAAPAAEHSPEQTKAPAAHSRSRTRTVTEQLESDDVICQQHAAQQLRRREVMTNLYLYGDNQLHKILDSLKIPGNHKKLHVHMVLDGKRGSTLVHYAAALGRVPLVRALLQAGASPTVTAYGGETPLMRAVYHMACYDSQTFAQLTNLLRDSVYVADLASRTVLHHIAKAAKRRDIWTAAGYYARCVAQVLEEEYSEALDLLPQVVNLRDSQGNTALHYACKYGNRVVTEILLRLGAATDITNNNGETPLDVARNDARLIALLHMEIDRDDSINWDDFEDDDDVMSIDLEDDLSESDEDIFERSPSPNPVVRNLHEQTMQHLDKFYGDRTGKILSSLIPNSPRDGRDSQREHEI